MFIGINRVIHHQERCYSMSEKTVVILSLLMILYSLVNVRSCLTYVKAQKGYTVHNLERALLASPKLTGISNQRLLWYTIQLLEYVINNSR